MKESKLSYPSFFLGEVPVLPPVEEGEEQFTPEQAFQIGFEHGAEHVVEHVYTFWQERLTANRGQVSKTYNDVLPGRVKWLRDIFNGATPNPTGEFSG
jgi:hypothetical protein